MSMMRTCAVMPMKDLDVVLQGVRHVFLVYRQPVAVLPLDARH
jgi:hypothetical protein